MQQMPAAPHAPVALQPPTRSEGPVVPLDELAILGGRYPNIMIMAPDSTAEAALGEMLALLRQPITSVHVEPLVELPLTLTQGTLILRDVEALNSSEQWRLQKWLERTYGATQVVATTPVAVFPSVERGSFSAILYYRLNTVYLEVFR